MKDIKTLINLSKQILSILDKRQKHQMIGVLVAILVGSFLELLGVSAMLPFVQSIVSPNVLIEKPYVRIACKMLGISDTRSIIILVGVGIVIVYIIKNAYLAFSKYLQAEYCNYTRKDLSVLMMKSYLDRPYSYLVDVGTGAISRGVNSCMEGVYQVIYNSFMLISESLVVISVAIYLVITDWLLAIGLLIVGFLCLVLIVLGMKKRISFASQTYRNALEMMSKWFYQITGGIKDILVYGRQRVFVDKYGKAFEATSKAMTYYTFIGALPERIIELFCASGIIVTVLIRVSIGVDVNSFVPSMAVFAMGAFRLLPSISRITGYINALVYYRGFVEEAYDNMREASIYRNTQLNKSEELRLEDKNTDLFREFSKDIRIVDLYWKYKDEGRDILKGLSINIQKGEAIGIVGSSGSGKSTLADLLLRLYHPQNGEILLDGINIDAIPHKWSEIIGYVPQTVFLVDDTIRENIVFGADYPNDDKVWESLKKASLDSFVNDLPKGLDTIVGERGVRLSGGQRQRIAISRALYSNPQILVLDEATSALDNETEESVMEAIDSLAGTITLIIIAHRLSTLKSCDKIFEIVDGKAIERNKELLLSKGNA